ncbi:uncharacterized protein [Clytia hemisphaerica]|uniref:uncharacterized protein n=1 Tax=Clytia hemisphaerica TaxID=252671 RepID=UPI0034D4815B
MNWLKIFMFVATAHNLYSLQYATATNYESFEIDEEKCSREEPGIKTPSTTECLLHCGKSKCMNSLIDKNQTCFCTEQECALIYGRKKQKQNGGIAFFTSQLQKANIRPICYGTHNNSYGTFKIPLTGRVRYFHLVHVSGYVDCNRYTAGTSKWRCGENADDVFTGITDTNNIVLAPTGTQYYGGRYVVKRPDHLTDGELNLMTDTNVEYQQNQEFRIWFMEDLINFTEEDNEGTHCVDVFIKYC